MLDVGQAIKATEVREGQGATPAEITADDRAQNPRSPDVRPNAGVRSSVAAVDGLVWTEAIHNSINDAIIGTDISGVVTYWNKGAELMFGFTADEIAGGSISAIIPEELAGEEEIILRRISGDDKINHFETERQCKDGRRRPVTLTISPVYNNRNELIGICQIASNLSEDNENAELQRLTRHLVRERDRAERANRSKSRFVEGMSHELRTPLNGVLGYAHLLQLEGDLNATQHMRVEAMLTAGKHLLQMINTVLDLCEIETGHLELRHVECDVLEIATTCLSLIHPEADAKGLGLSLATTYVTGRKFVTDPMRLRQVLFNLLGNAVKFTRKGSIELRLQAVGGGSALRIEVIDTGPGISAAQCLRLFQDFERLDPTDMIEGAGLGLALSSRIAALMGGRLGHNDNPAGGSVFWLELPANAVSMPVPTAAPPDDLLDSKTMSAVPLEVLVVDDVLPNRDIAAAFLRAAGHNVVCVEGGAAAIAAVAGTDFDLVLMDVRMPEMDGLEATRRIRALGGQRGQIPIVAVTAQAFTEQVAKCREAGMNSHLSKPFSPEGLLAAVADAVRGEGRRFKHIPSSASATSAIGSELIIFDRIAFDRIEGYLAPAKVDGYLQEIASCGENLLRLLAAGSLTKTGDKLAEEAHALAGRAGMFGFEGAATLCRRFESSIQSDSLETPAIAEALRVAMEHTLRAIHALAMQRSTRQQGLNY